MDLQSVCAIDRPVGRSPATGWRPGDAYLAGGTWLFSEPQPEVTRLIDLSACAWPDLVVTDSGIELAATCTIARLYAFEAPAQWPAAALIRPCCEALLASFKIWNVATVGGNLCLSLPAGALIALTVALDGVCTLQAADGSTRAVAAADFVTGVMRNVLRPGEVLRAIRLPAAALARRPACRQISRTTLGRSAALLIGTYDPLEGGFALTVTAATTRPVRLAFSRPPGADLLRAAIDEAIDETLYLADMHGTPAWRRHLTYYLAEQIRAELAVGS